jgi:hypothetical protein
MHHEPPEVTWPLPELDVGVEVGELRLPDDELFDVPELDELFDVPELDELFDVPELDELFDVPELEDACRVLLDAEPEDVAAVAAPGRVNATPPAAIRLAAVAETVAARSRARPRSLAAAPAGMLCLRWLMTASVTGGSRPPLWTASQPPMSVRSGSPFGRLPAPTPASGMAAAG